MSEIHPTDGELVEAADKLGIQISPAAIAADARKLLRRSGIFEPSATQQATADRAAIEHYLLNVRKAKEAS